MWHVIIRMVSFSAKALIYFFKSYARLRSGISCLSCFVLVANPRVTVSGKAVR